MKYNMVSELVRGIGEERTLQATEPKMPNVLNGRDGIVRAVLQVGKAS